MFTNIHLQTLVVSIKALIALSGLISVGCSILAIIISIKRYGKSDHKEEHQRIEKKVDDLKTAVDIQFIEHDASNTRSHAEIRTENFNAIMLQNKLIKSIDDNVKILLRKLK